MSLFRRISSSLRGLHIFDIVVRRDIVVHTANTQFHFVFIHRLHPSGHYPHKPLLFHTSLYYIIRVV